jgi:uncharacterized protein (TIGR00290 family)
VKVMVSWSSGKDSAWMVHVLRSGGIVPAALLTTVNRDAARVAMHAVRVSLLEAQAAALDLPLWQVPIPSPCPNDVYERAMAGVVARAVAEGFTHMAFGDLFLEDIRRYREERLAGTGLTPMFPLFGSDTPALARSMIEGGIQARVTCLNPRVLPRAFAGRAFDAAFLDELPPEIDPCGERGEFHTFAWDGPMFRHPVPIEPGITVERDGFVFTDLVPSQGATSAHPDIRTSPHPDIPTSGHRNLRTFRHPNIPTFHILTS